MTDVPLSRRRLLVHAMQLCAAGVMPIAFTRSAYGQSSASGIATRGRPDPAPARPGTWLVLLGTVGGPGIDPSRAQTSSAVVIDGRPYLVDCGYGTLRQLVASHVGYLGLNTLFLTHLHDDHTGDLAALMSFQWTNGKTDPTDVYGPFGTARMVQAAVEFSQANVKIRTIDEGRTVEAVRLFRGHDVSAEAQPLRIFSDGRIHVSAVENTHFPPRATARMSYRSLALRFDSRHRSIVIAGDTAYSANVVQLARGADVFVCEVVDPSVLEAMRRRGEAAAATGNANNIFRHVAETHCSPADVARMASEANVKSVVLNHLVLGPTSPNELAYPITTLVDAVRRGFQGEVILGQDLMVL